MAGLFRTRQPFLQTNAWQNQALNALHYNTSQQGSVVPVLYGTVRQQVNLINFANYLGPNGKKGKTGSIPITGTSNTGKGGGGGKGKGGKKGGGEYSIDVDFAICQGPVVFNGNNLVFSSTGVAAFDSVGLNFYTGEDGQAPDPTFDSFGFPIGYSGTVHVTGTPMILGQSPVIPNLSFEITGFYTGVDTGAAFPQDANPAWVIYDFLTNERYGTGFPSVNIDPDILPGSGGYGDYCQAAMLLISIALDGHQKAIDWLNPLTNLTNSALVWSGKILKIIPYGDVLLAQNEVTWTPNLTPVYSLTDDDFLPWTPHHEGSDPRPGEEDPILVTRKNTADAMNWLNIEYTDRNNFYNVTTITAQDQSLIDQYGLRIGDEISGRAFCNVNSAQISAQLALQRSIYVRNTPYKFKAGWRYALLEPMDLILLTGRSGDSYLYQQPVRILNVEEDDEGSLTFEAEEVQVGASHPVPTPPVNGMTLDGRSFLQTALVGVPQTITITTTKPNDIIDLMVILNEEGAPTPSRLPYVISIEDNIGLDWNKRGDPVNGIVPDAWLHGPVYVDIEHYWAVMSTPGELIITINSFSDNQGWINAMAFSVNGANLVNPWDFNSSLPAVNSDWTGASTTPLVVDVSSNTNRGLGLCYEIGFGFNPFQVAATANAWDGGLWDASGRVPSTDPITSSQSIQIFAALITITGVFGRFFTSRVSGGTFNTVSGTVAKWTVIADVMVAA